MIFALSQNVKPEFSSCYALLTSGFVFLCCCLKYLSLWGLLWWNVTEHLVFRYMQCFIWVDHKMYQYCVKVVHNINTNKFTIITLSGLTVRVCPLMV